MVELKISMYVSMPGKVNELIQQINASHTHDNITCVLADSLLSWAMEIALDNQIKPASFVSFSATASVLISSIPKLIQDGIISHDGTPRKKQMVEASPSMPAMNTSSHFVWARNRLQLSNRPFLWVVRPDIADKLNIGGFQERVGSRGLIISWAPQQKVLKHPSIAHFFTDCGWNSVLEAITNGVPLLCWPFSDDHFLIEHYICNVWKIGLGFNREDGEIITKEDVISKSEELLSNGKYKANTLDLKEKLLNSIKQGGSSYNNFMAFVAWLKA
ncbi:hypothetical protein EZV62_004911 [Acer yangbiense]|uniref:UDP-glycosyltransferases domain-containing protein n=1 Tax=Acer yangbiense TaxID=1000413 RepID=A0A5C7INE5_9ROSI|nr:hypothetical protein EZV62_004911 [Acer yangbiense]